MSTCGIDNYRLTPEDGTEIPNNIIVRQDSSNQLIIPTSFHMVDLGLPPLLLRPSRALHTTVVCWISNFPVAGKITMPRPRTRSQFDAPGVDLCKLLWVAIGVRNHTPGFAVSLGGLIDRWFLRCPIILLMVFRQPAL